LTRERKRERGKDYSNVMLKGSQRGGGAFFIRRSKKRGLLSGELVVERRTRERKDAGAHDVRKGKADLAKKTCRLKGRTEEGRKKSGSPMPS